MLVNILRTQARTVFGSCRNITPVIAKHGAGRSMQSLLPGRAMSRLLLTSGVFRNEARLVEPIKRRFGSGSSTSETDTLYMGNIPYNAEEGELRELLKSFGPIRDVRLSHRSDGTSLGYAHVQFEDVSSAKAALESHNEEPFYILGRSLRLDYASKPSFGEPHSKLYFNRFTGNEAEMRKVARDFESSILSVRLLQDPNTGVHTGSGFIEFVSVERASDALKQLNGTTHEGKTINLRYAKKPLWQTQDGASGNQRGQRGGYGGDWEGSRRSEGYQQRRGSTSRRNREDN